MRDKLASMHPTVLEGPYSKRDAFKVGARPHFILMLDHHEMHGNPNLRKHVSQGSFLMSGGGVSEWRNEWKTLDIAEQFIDASSECWTEWLDDTSADDSLWNF